MIIVVWIDFYSRWSPSCSFPAPSLKYLFTYTIILEKDSYFFKCMLPGEADLTIVGYVFFPSGLHHNVLETLSILVAC